MTARRSVALLAGLVLALLVSVTPSEAQGTASCVLVYQNGPWQVVGAPEARIISADGPLLVRCNNGEELRADSAVVYELSDEVHLFGNVDYQDPTRALTADQAIYTGGNGRLYATGNVVFTDKQRGSTLRGPELEYFRAMAGRPQPQAIATQRPHLTVVPRAEEGRERRDPLEVDANRITTVGEQNMTAEGDVVIEGKDLRSTADEAFYDSDTERLELRRRARVVGEKYQLSADYIETELENGALTDVLARRDAHLVSERLTVDGPELRLFFADDLLQRLVSHRGQVAPRPAPAVVATDGAPPAAGDSAAAAGDSAATGGEAAIDPAARSVALAKGFRLEADSLEAIMPGQRLKEVHAIGQARGEAWDTATVASPAPADAPALPAPDSLGPQELGQRDLLFADTIIGYFKPDSAAADTVAADTAGAAPGDTVRGPGAAQGDTAQNAELERMVAIGNARSLYRMRDEDSDSTAAAAPDSAAAAEPKKGINYVIGDKIDLTFLEGEVDVARIIGLKRGVYLDPGETRPAGQPADGQPGARPVPAGQPAPPGGAPPTAQRGQPPRPAQPATGGRP